MVDGRTEEHGYITSICSLCVLNRELRRAKYEFELDSDDEAV